MKSKKVLLGSLLFASMILTSRVLAEAPDIQTDIEHGQTTGDNYKTTYIGDWKDLGDWHAGYGDLEVTFTGHRSQIWATKTDVSGVIEVWVDGVKHGEFDAYSADDQLGVNVYTVSDLEEGQHTIALKQKEYGSYFYYNGMSTYRKAEDIPYTSLTLAENEIKLDHLNRKQLTWTAGPNNANETINFTSSNPDVASVDQTGMIQAHKEGSAEITVATKNITQNVAVTVIPAENNIQVSPGSTAQHTLQDQYDNLIDLQEQESATTPAWLGDEVNGQFILRSKSQDLQNVKVTASDFTSSQGSISKEQVSTYFLKETSAYIGRGGQKFQMPDPNAPHEMIPDILDRADSVNIAANRLQAVWLKVQVPTDIPAGTYHGTFTVTADNLQKPLEIPYSFEVLPVQQPQDKQRFSMELWQYPFTTARYYGLKDDELFTEKHLNILKQELSEYAKIGGGAITTTISEDPWNNQTYDKYPSMVKWTKKADGHFEFDFTNYDKYVELAMSLGINKQIKSFSLTPWENHVGYFDEAIGQVRSRALRVGTPEWNDVWGQFMQAYIQHLDQKGWFDITYMSMDERPLDTMQHVVDLIEKYKNKDGKTMKISAAMNYTADNAKILDHIHDISIDLAQINDENAIRLLAQKRRENNLTTTLYTCVGDYPSSFTRSAPIESAWTLWYAQYLNMDGYLRWAYDAWVKDPLTSVDHWWWESGDPFLVYPGDKDGDNKNPRTSPRFENFKAAKRQIEKLRWIKEKVPEAAAEIDEFVNTLRREHGVVNAYGAHESTGVEQNKAVESEVARMNQKVNELTIKYLSKLAKVSTQVPDTAPSQEELPTFVVPVYIENGTNVTLDKEADQVTFKDNDLDTQVSVTVSREGLPDQIHALVVEKISKDSNYILNGKKGDSYDIYFVDKDGKRVPVNQTAKVMIPVKHKVNGAYYIQEDGKLSEVPFTQVDEGHVELTVSHFSQYGVTYETADQPDQPSEKPADKPGNSSNSNQTMQPGQDQTVKPGSGDAHQTPSDKKQESAPQEKADQTPAAKPASDKSPEKANLKQNQGQKQAALPKTNDSEDTAFLALVGLVGLAMAETLYRRKRR